MATFAFAPRAFAQGAVRLPMQIIKGKIFIEVRVNGRPLQAMVDSGASYSGIDTRMAQALGIEPKGRKVALRHVQGGSSGRWADGVWLGVGVGAVARSILVTDFGLLTASILHPVTVLIGADILAGHVVQFDLDAGVLTLHPRPGFTAPPGAVLAGLAPPKGLSGGGTPMTTPVVVEGAVVHALVDTGSQSPLIVSPSVARRLKLLEGRTVSTSPIGGIGGASAGQIASLKAVELGRREFQAVPVQVTARALASVEANLGLDLLSRFNLWLDLGGARLWLALRKTQPSFSKNLLGFFGLPDGDEAIRITFVAKDSPADTAGLKVGDIVTRIDGKPANAAQLLLADAPAGTTLALTLQDGRAKTLTLAPYY